MTQDTINDDLTRAGGDAMLAGRYRVVRQLGQGGMGSVWLTEDAQLDNRLFAVKMLPSILVSNKRAYNQLKSEALVSLKLVHPNIVALRAFEENGGNPFLVMDYIEGRTLDEYLAEKGKLSEEETVELLNPIAAALDYAHGKGVVHRDIKPANVMIAKDGTPFILDFGIAREIQETLTRVTGKLSSGTLLYMSPEQLNGASPKAPQDVYSFAVMVYECLNGEPPFVRGQIDHQILNSIPPPLPKGIGIAANVMKGLAKKAEDRPSTCSGVLAGANSGKGGVAHGHGWFWLLLLLVMGGAAAGVYWHFTQASSHEADAEQPPKQEIGGDVSQTPTNRPAVVPPDTNGVEVTDSATLVAEEVKPQEVKPLKEPERKPISKEPEIDMEFIRLTNELAVAVNERDKAYESAKAYRSSPRGFSAKFKVIDGAWSQRTSIGNDISKQKAAEMLAVVKRETATMQEAAKWIADNAAARDAAVKKEADFGKSLAARKDEDSDLFDRAKRNGGWVRIQEAIASARKQVDEGAFEEAAKLFDDAKKSISDILESEKASREEEKRKKQEEEARRRQEEEARKRAEAEKALMERLDKEGFILDETANKYPPGTEKRVMLPNGESIAMVWCPPGWFMMGSPISEEDRGIGEIRHAVQLSKGFWIGKYEVTESQWGAVMQDGSSGRKPKREVSWKDCKEGFIRRLNSMLNGQAEMRLPTEAEWEYACRAGQQTPFSFGSRNDGEFLDGTQACCAGKNTYPMRRKTLLGGNNSWWPDDVGHYQAYANDWGINDMHGNVYEWCEDVYAPYPSEKGLSVNPMSLNGFSDTRVIRGGCWNHPAKSCRSAFRTSKAPGDNDHLTGFRLCCDTLP